MADEWYETLKNGKCLTERDLKSLCEKVKCDLTSGKRTPSRRIKCSTSKCPSDNLR